jgi:DNA-binding MarR family transcriptional regulator
MNFIEAMNYFYYRTSLNELRWMQREDHSFGLSYHSLLYLNIIAGEPHCTVSRLAERLGISTPGVTEKVNGLVQKGLVEKVQSETDHRVFHLALRADVRDRYESWDRFSGDLEKRLRETYTERDIELFCSMLRDIADYEPLGEPQGFPQGFPQGEQP